MNIFQYKEVTYYNIWRLEAVNDLPEYLSPNSHVICDLADQWNIEVRNIPAIYDFISENL